MLYAKDFRSIARETLAGKWGLAIGSTFVAALLGAETYVGSGARVTSEQRNSFSHWYNNSQTDINYVGDVFREKENIVHSVGNVIRSSHLAPVLTFVLMIIMCIGLIWFVLGAAMDIGLSRFYLDLMDQKDSRFETIFSGFNIFGRAFLMKLLITIYTFLWFLLFIIPGIIAIFSYSQAKFIMAENPDIDVSEAIFLSKEMMRGNKWRLFCMDISFIGWAILCALTFNLGNIILAPYKCAARAAFYKTVSTRNYE